MNLAAIKQHVGNWERSISDNPGMMCCLIIAALLVAVILGGMLIDMLVHRKRERDKVKAVERLHKHLQSLPSSKS
jgi:hypothetical protein